MMSAIVRFDETSTAPQTDHPAPDRLISGAPVHTTWLLDEGMDGRLFSGIWRSTPGKWRVVYEEWEYCHILEGVSRIESDDGAVIEATAGTRFVLKPGFAGTWEVIETTTKDFVVTLP